MPWRRAALQSPASEESVERLTQFANLAAAAIAGAENKANLSASRARVVATADETRRQLQRDVHDTAQQRLVHTIVSPNLDRDALTESDAVSSLVEEALAHAVRARRDVRVAAPRLPVRTETTSYFMVAGALNNVVKHADAAHAGVDVTLNNGILTAVVSDDGSGGTALVGGTGLLGLLDRVEAGGGQLTITSPQGMGTTLHATLPLEALTSSAERACNDGGPAAPLSIFGFA